MGFIGDMFSSGKGAGFQASNPDFVTKGQTEQAYRDQQNALAQQQNLINNYGQFAPINRQGGVLNQQQDLANMLMQQAQGQGPNPALAQLSQTTGANVANQAALMAGQRGSGSNVGMIARQAGQVGSQAQQQAVGQAAVLRANQQLAAQQALQQQQQSMAGNAANMAAGQAAAIGGYGQQALQAQSNLLNAGTAMQSNINNANASIAGINAQNQGKIFGGLLGGAGSVLGLAQGGEVPHYAEGGPSSYFGKFLSGASNAMSSTPAGQAPDPLEAGMMQFGKGLGSAMKKGAHYLTNPMSFSKNVAPAGMADMPSQVNMAAHGGKIKNMAASGGHVPGQAKVDGDNYKNDVVPAMLSPGEIVLPRSVTKSEEAPKKAAEFVAAVMARRKRR